MQWRLQRNRVKRGDTEWLEEHSAYVVEAEAEVPKALAYALREGKLGIMDYYDMQNIKADTKMRENIAREDINAKKILEGDAHEPKDVL